uniref:CHK kinase-like domain-containing protein n=1 Tax=Panagrolaimus davidi TaxID=227884 RepID=A0A914Q5H7_9BILA
MVTFYDVSGGKGFLSVVLRCTVKFIDSISEKDVYHTILKVPGMESIEEATKKCDYDIDEETQKKSEGEKNAFLENSHKFECEFYSILAPLLDTPCPKVYKALDIKVGEKEGVIHMEDLTLRGKTILYFDNINLTQVKCVIQHFAHMHYKNLTIDQSIWRGKFMKNQEALAAITEHIDLMINPMIKSSKREEDFAPFVDKLRKFYSNKEFALYSTKQSYIDLEMPPVLVHGDMHSGNIMWAIDEDGNIQNELAAFVDWQIMHEGSPMSDLARFLTHCCDGVVRRQAETFAIEFYFECLIKEFGSKEKVPYTIEKLKKAYNYCFLTQAFYSMAIIQMLFLAIADKAENESIKNAYYDFAILKALHLFEDVDRLLEGDMKDVFEKYGV